MTWSAAADLHDLRPRRAVHAGRRSQRHTARTSAGGAHSADEARQRLPRAIDAAHLVHRRGRVDLSRSPALSQGLQPPTWPAERAWARGVGQESAGPTQRAHQDHGRGEGQGGGRALDRQQGGQRGARRPGLRHARQQRGRGQRGRSGRRYPQAQPQRGQRAQPPRERREPALVCAPLSACNVLY